MYQWPFDPERVAELEVEDSARLLSAAPLPDPLRQVLETNLKNDLILPDDARYAKERRVFNRAFDPFPAAIAICGSEAQAALCLTGAQQFAVPFCIRGSGHSFAGYSCADDALVIDLRKLNSIAIDATQGTVTVGAGCTHKILDAALKAQNLRLSLGADPLTVGGYMQGGGYGLFGRTLGMNCDSAIEVRVMLADGQIITANETVNHDLWWAMRGGTGCNFGLLLSVTYRLIARTSPAGRTLSWKLVDEPGRSNGADAIYAVQTILQTAPDALSLQVDIRYWPDDPQDTSRTPWLNVFANFFGSEADLDVLLAPLADLDPALLQAAALAHPVNNPFVRHAVFLPDLQTDDWRALIDNFLSGSNRLSTLTIDAMGGAINAYPLEKSAFIHRDSSFNVYVTGFWVKDDRQDREVVEAYLESFGDLTAPFGNGRILQNFPYLDPPDFRKNYWGDAFPALFAVKRKYDPARAFTFAQAVDAGVSAPAVPRWPPKVVEWLARPIVI